MTRPHRDDAHGDNVAATPTAPAARNAVIRGQRARVHPLLSAPGMHRLTTAAVAAAAVALSGAQATAQPLSNPLRVSGNQVAVNAMRPLGRLDCANERIRININLTGDGTVFNALEFWVGLDGSACMNATTRTGASPTCWQIRPATISGQQSMYVNNDYRIAARYLVDPVNGDCNAPPQGRVIGTNQLALLVSSASGLNMSGMSLAIPYDLEPPQAPTNIGATPGEASVEVTWRYQASTTTGTTDDASTSSTTDGSTSSNVATTDLAGFYVLCDPPLAAPPADGGTDAGVDAAIVPDATFGGGDDAGSSGACSGAFPTIARYDTAAFARDDRTGRTRTSATSAQVTGLVNGQSYRCVVVSEDLAGNRAVSTPTACVVPAPVTDFWERYRQAGGGARPECNARGGGASRDGAWWIAGMAALALASRRRRMS